MHFTLFGPYDIVDKTDKSGKGYAGWLDKPDFDHLWDEADKATPGLSQACGVYLFGVRDGKRKGKHGVETLPWYVGKAEKQSFRKECFNHKNQNAFNRVLFLENRGRGTPFLYVLARGDNEGFSGTSTTTGSFKDIGFVEQLLTELAFGVNPDLVNVHFTKQPQATSIPGVLNTQGGRPSESSRQFRTLFNIARPMEMRIPDGKETGADYPYDVLGPYPVPVKNKRPKVIDPEDVDQMWADIRGREPEIPAASGVYVLAIKHGDSYTPWYIGTASKAPFRDRCLLKDMEQINPVVQKRGTPMIYFLPLRTKTGKLAKASEKDQVRANNMAYVKALLLRYGAQVNPEIFSEDPRDADLLRDLRVDGLINRSRGRPSKQIDGFRALMGLGR